MKKYINVMATTAMVASVVAPIGAFAASGSITALSTPVVGKSTTAELGRVKVVVPKGSSTQDQKLIIKLSDGELNGYNTVGGITYGQTISTANGIVFPKLGSGATNENGLSAADVKEFTYDDDQINITLNKDVSLSYDGEFYVYFGSVNTKDADNGQLKATLSASPNSGYPTGEVVVGQTSSVEQVSLSAASVDADNQVFNWKLNVVEDAPESIKDDYKVKLKLPAGYKWDSSKVEKALTFDYNYGSGVTAVGTLGSEGQELTITFAVDEANYKLSPFAVTNLEFYVDDEDKVKEGDIVAKVSSSGVKKNVSDLVVGVYGDYDLKAEAIDDVPTIVAGKKEQEIADIKIIEAVKASLIKGRTVSLKIKEGAKWSKASDSTTDEGTSLDLKTTVSTADPQSTIKFTVSENSTDAAELKLEDFEVLTQAGFEGDLVVQITGTDGSVQEVTVAEVVKPVQVTAENVPSVTVGRYSQKAADVTITESVAEALADNDGKITLELPEGVQFDGTPKVEVADGDLSIKDVDADGRFLSFDVDSESYEASTIKITGINLSVYRDVPEGDITLKIKGADIIDEESTDEWSTSDVAAKVVIAKVATPAPNDTTGSASFVIDSTTYTVNGVEKTADVAPYIKNGRTMLPIRYVADALGVADSNIIWNDAARTVTLIKGDRIAQMTIGSNILTINGTPVQMDAAAEIKDGRTTLPLRFAAQALGATIEWDEATRTVSIN